MVVRRPFEELDLRDTDWLEPTTFGHLGLRESLSPPPASRFWQIDERACRDLERLELLEETLANRRRETVASSGDIHQTVAVVISEDQRIECFCADRVSADDEFLRTIDAHLPPRPGSQARLVRAVTALRDQPL